MAIHNIRNIVKLGSVTYETNLKNRIRSIKKDKKAFRKTSLIVWPDDQGLIVKLDE